MMRYKGCFIDKETKKLNIMQGVEDLFEFREIDDAGTEESSSSATSQFLFVGRGDISADEISKLIIEKCI